MSKITNLNNYTLLEQSIIDKIYFYPESAISNTKIKRKNDNLCVLFAIEKEKYTPLFKMNTTLINDGKIIYECYSLYLKRLEPYKYVVLNNKNDYLHAEILPKEIIDFNTLEYDSFIKILKENQELSKMIPELTNALKSNMNNLEIEKKVATKIDIPSPTHYYQNITGYQVDFLEKQITPEEELNLSKKILKNINKLRQLQKNYVALKFYDNLVFFLAILKGSLLLSWFLDWLGLLSDWRDFFLTRGALLFNKNLVSSHLLWLLRFLSNWSESFIA